MVRPIGSTRQRMLESAVALLRENSAAGVSIDAVLAHSGAPRGSIYHHFPGGRDEMIAGAVELAGQRIADLIEAAPDDPHALVGAFMEFWRKTLHATDNRAGCPVLAVAVDTADEISAAAARDVFALWHRVLSNKMRASGLAPAAAQRFANVALAATEGAVLLCRVQRSPKPLADVEISLREMLDLLA